MTAAEAREKTNNPIGLDGVLSAIENDVNNGMTFHVTPPNLLFDAQLIGELVKLGYTLKSREDIHTGLPFYVITWQ